MAITETEAGLTESQWQDLTELVSDAIYEVTLYRWNPQFTVSVTGNSSAYDYDSVVASGTIYKANASEVMYLNSSWQTIAGYSSATGQLTNSPVSLVGGSGLHVFAATSTGISRRVWNGASWDSWTEIVTDSTVVYIAATALDTVHYITYDSTNKHYHLKVATLSGTWSASDSDIYWGFQITSFAAKRLGNKDILTITTTLPGTVSARTVGTKLVKYVLPSGGVVGFTYQYGSWSDHFVIDLVDQYSSFRYREACKLSLIGDTLWLTAYSSESTSQHPVEGLRVYSSKDGRHWSRGELLDVSANAFGAQISQLDTTLYLLTSDQVRTSPSTLWFGNTDLVNVMDVSRYVSSLSFQRQDMQQISFTLSNPDGWLSSTFSDGDQTMACILKTGFWDGTDSLLIPVGIFEVDSIRPAKEKPVTQAVLVGRDRMSWISSKSQSEQFVNWDPQKIGVDSYVDSTGTGYGGMTHTAPLTGSYNAYESTLKLKSSNSEGMAASTWLYDTWNGAVETHFQLSQLANDEYAGVLFRTQDKDNGFLWYYNQSDDKIYFKQRLEGVDTTLWSSSTKGWDDPIATWTLRAEFYYSRIRLYSGDNQAAGLGVLWNLEQELLVDGEDLVENGYVGTIGKGYSDQDSWENTPDPIPTWELPPDYSAYSYLIADFDWEEA